MFQSIMHGDKKTWRRGSRWLMSQVRYTFNAAPEASFAVTGKIHGWSSSKAYLEDV